MDEPTIEVDQPVGDDELNALYAASWPAHQPQSFRWLFERNLTWVAARRLGTLVGWAYVAGDGGQHAFLLDPTVHPDERRRGLGVRLVAAATEASRAAGAEWLHVDFEPHLAEFYTRCGFLPTQAGLVRLAD